MSSMSGIVGPAATVRPGGHPAWLVAFVPATIFAFPQRFGDFMVDGGLWLGPLSVLCLVLGISGLRPRRAAGRAFLASWLAHAAILHWIYVAMVRHGGAPPPVGVLAVLAIAVYPAVATAAVAAVLAWLSRGGSIAPLVAAAVFTLGDHLQSFVAGGFPWTLLGYTQHRNPALLPLAAFGAVYLVGFATALSGALFAAGVDGFRRGAWRSRPISLGAIVWIALHAIGLWVGAARPIEVAPATRRVAVLQGNIEQGRKWTPENRSRTLAHYESLTRSAADAGAELIVWPETAVPSPIELDDDAYRRVSQLARDVDATLVIGAVGVRVAPTSGSVTDWYDSAFAVEPDGRFVARYDKTKLVPFGEFLPFRAVLGRFIRAIARGAAVLDVSPGAAPIAMPVEVRGDRDGEMRDVRLGVPICYELLFPELVRHFVVDGAELLVAITNDAWYGRTGAPDQFLAITALRAAENGVALVRAANTGYSAIIDARGRVRERSALFERGYVIADVGLGGGPGAAGASFFARHGAVFVVGCWGAVLLRVAVESRARFGSGRRSGPDGAAGAAGTNQETTEAVVVGAGEG